MIPSRVQKEIKQIPSGDRERVIGAIKKLKRTLKPHGAVLLARGVYRVRVGRYRVVYKFIEDKNTIIVGRAIKRDKRTYKRLKDI